jgi:DNA-binding NarL/FixJ family response regulator
VQSAPDRQVGVLIVDDDPMVRGWVRLSLDSSDFRVVGEAATAEEAAALIERRQPHVILVDQNLGGDNGTAFVRSLRQRNVAVLAIVMTANAQRGFNEIAREAGAQGTLLKSGSTEELLETLEAVAEGGQLFDARHPRRSPGRAALSPREREVLGHVAAGRSNHEIATLLGVGEETVKTLLARVFTKLGVRKRAEAVATAHKQGLL